jgi:hypothetical protein
LTHLYLNDNQLSSIESDDFSGLTSLAYLWLGHNTTLTELNLAEADFSSLIDFNLGDDEGRANIRSVSLRNTVVSQTSLAALLDGGPPWDTGIGDIDGITEMDLSGVDFGNITDLEPLYMMDHLIDLWLVDTLNLDASDLDVLLDNLATIEGVSTEGILHMTQANFDGFNTGGGGLLAAWDAEPGHHVALVIPAPLLGDLNLDGVVNGLDVNPFVEVLLNGPYQSEADMNEDQVVNGLDVDPFVSAVLGSGAHQIPEPATLFLCIVALGVVGGWHNRSGL